MTTPSANRSRLVALVVFAVALAVHGAVYAVLSKDPFVQVRLLDAQQYDSWGWRIAQGDWRGHDVFYQAPLYAYFLGAVYRLVGHRPELATILQLRAASVNTVVILALGRRAFGLSVGLVAACASLLYGPSCSGS